MNKVSKIILTGVLTMAAFAVADFHSPKIERASGAYHLQQCTKSGDANSTACQTYANLIFRYQCMDELGMRGGNTQQWQKLSACAANKLAIYNKNKDPKRPLPVYKK